MNGVRTILSVVAQALQVLAAQLQTVAQLLLGRLDRLDLVGVVGGSFLLAFLLLLGLVHLTLHATFGVGRAFLHDTQIVTETENSLPA